MSVNFRLRRALAFLLTPMLVPILLYRWISELMGSPAWIKVVLVIATVSAYAGVLVFGVPLLLFLWKGRTRNAWATCVAGLFVGMVSWLLFAAMFPVMLGQEFQGIALSLSDPKMLSGVFWPGELSGAVVGIAVWLMARPDNSI
jgi:hypothetical protein